MNVAWESLIEQLEGNPSLVCDLFDHPLQPADALLLEELELILQHALATRMNKVLEGDAEIMPDHHEREEFLRNLEAQRNIRALLAHWGTQSLN